MRSSCAIIKCSEQSLAEVVVSSQAYHCFASSCQRQYGEICNVDLAETSVLSTMYTPLNLFIEVKLHFCHLPLCFALLYVHCDLFVEYDWRSQTEALAASSR